ncbi:MAG: hypothetical protein JF888_04745 [Candidatus Dormibacteraeota bacterium]|uniref:Uncharacterized protein n=1 Tax=Candidatus Dormiibacter inghamiae TaxID=3127013 RepID=A0A934KI29_9BACT|nr:hypothetical protein [Candidatus Dormibacteraeota bacterium]MBJ7605098.1 hypothetical protein [Candidatus Dormibacteraeota bacterium]
MTESQGGKQLRLERSGGFAGLLLRASFQYSQLSEAERGAVEQCFQRWPGSDPAAGQPDRFSYRLELAERSALVPEAHWPEALKALLTALRPTAG